MAKKFFEISDEQRKVLEGTDAGKAILKSIEDATSAVDRAMIEADTKVSSAEKARKELEDSLLNPDMLEELASRRKPEARSTGDEENLDDLPPSKLVARMRQERDERMAAFEKSVKSEFAGLTKKVAAAFQTLQVEALEDRHGEKFLTNKEKLAEFAMQPENQSLRPRDVFAKYMDKVELETKRKADAEAKAAQEAKEKEQSSFLENPDSALASSAAGEKTPPKDNDEAFDRAWAATPGAEKLLRTE